MPFACCEKYENSLLRKKRKNSTSKIQFRSRLEICGKNGMNIDFIFLYSTLGGLKITICQEGKNREFPRRGEYEVSIFICSTAPNVLLILLGVQFGSQIDISRGMKIFFLNKQENKFVQKMREAQVTIRGCKRAKIHGKKICPPFRNNGKN